MMRKRIFPIILIVVLILSIILIAHRTIVYYNFKKDFLRAKLPELYALSTNRIINNKDRKDEALKTLNCFNLYFEVNGRELNRQETSDLISIELDGDRKIIVRDKNDFKLTDSFYDEFSKSELEKVKELFGERIFSSDYVFYENIFKVSPDQVSYFTPLEEMYAKHTLLILKSIIMMPGYKDGIYSFQLENIKGFQIGIPQKSNMVTIQFYDEEENEYMILVSGQNVSQDDIDSILTSLRVK